MKRKAFEPDLLHRLPEPPHKVAILRASRIGDFICATPALHALRTALPQAEITLITLPMLQEIAARLPYIDRTAAFPGYPGIAEQLFEPQQAARFFTEMQAEHFDLAIQMQGSGVNSNPFILMLGARYAAGFIRPGDSPGLLDAALPLPTTGHEAERVQSLASFLGAPGDGRPPEYPLLPEDLGAAQALLENLPRPLIGLHPSARALTRRWPPERFLKAGLMLQNRRGGTLVWLGEAEERGMIEALSTDDAEYSSERMGTDKLDESIPIRSSSVDIPSPCKRGDRGELQAPMPHLTMRSNLPAINLAGYTPLPVLGAVISQLDVFITNDTGPAHIAYALGAPTVTIFGGGDPGRYGPLNQGPFRLLVHPVLCRPCEYVQCPIGYKCLELVSVEEVVSAVETTLRHG